MVKFAIFLCLVLLVVDPFFRPAWLAFLIVGLFVELDNRTPLGSGAARLTGCLAMGALIIIVLLLLVGIAGVATDDALLRWLEGL